MSHVLLTVSFGSFSTWFILNEKRKLRILWLMQQEELQLKLLYDYKSCHNITLTGPNRFLVSVLTILHYGTRNIKSELNQINCHLSRNRKTKTVWLVDDLTHSSKLPMSSVSEVRLQVVFLSPNVIIASRTLSLNGLFANKFSRVSDERK